MAAGWFTPCCASKARDLEAIADSFDAASVSASDVKYMKQRAYSRQRSRGEQVHRFKRGD